MGRNNKSIHLLRGNKNNHPSEVLDPGQPFYDKYGRSIYVGDGDTSLSALMPISGGWDYIDKGEASSAGYHLIPSSTILSKIKTAGFLHCSHNGNVVAIQGLNRDDGRTAVTDIWHLIYIHNSPNSTLKDGAILAIGDTAGVFYGTIANSLSASGESITWGRLTNQSRLSYTGEDSNTYVELNENSLIPKTANSVNLGSKDNRFNTIYAGKYFLPGQRFDFKYNYDYEEVPALSAKIGFSCTDPNGVNVKISQFEFYDGGLTDNSDGSEFGNHLTWIRAKGIKPYNSNEINFDLQGDGVENIYFCRNYSTNQIKNYKFMDGTDSAGTYDNYASIESAAKDIATQNFNAHSSYMFSNGIEANEEPGGIKNLTIPAWGQGVYIKRPTNTDGAIWITDNVLKRGVTRFYFINNGEAYLSPIEAPSFNATSDKRLKENIIPFTSEKSILDLPVYTFNFKSDKNKKKHVGCLAQDLQEICPDLVNEDSQGYLSIEESKITYLLLEEVKELKKRVKELEEKISNEEKVPNNSNNLSSSSDVLGDR